MNNQIIGTKPVPISPTIDVHMHLAGSGCCGSGIKLSEWFKRRYTFKLLKFKLGITDQRMNSTIDIEWPEMISQLLARSPINYGVVLGFDGVFSCDTGEERLDKLQMSIPTKWVFEQCKKFPNLLPGPSINPFRKDAIAELESAIEAGAVLIKWLPCTQDIDPRHAAIDDFYRLLAKNHVPLLVHMGGERTFHTVNHKLNDVTSLERPLSLGVKVICAHTATRIQFSDEQDQTHQLLQLLERYPHLWVDNSGLCNPVRFNHVPRLAKIDLIQQRTLYGSDWPVPSNAVYFAGRMPLRKIIQIESEKNQLVRDVEIKRYFGYSDATLSRANQVLSNLNRWIK
jgi:predicted TIM-barrel fold metal-dependent hydrolase